MKSYLIVDGYNIINSWTNLKKIANENMEEARDRLIEILADYRAYRGVEVILVFDAHFVKGNQQKEEFVHGIKVVFTKEHETADSYIERIVHNLSKYNFVQVATSDWAEQITILSGGGVRISARELEEEIKDSHKKMKRKFINQEVQNDDLSHRIEPHILEKLEKWRKRED
ncbi:NYN domain-containing protein [Garciella nitratireducens]|uniref:NYN domain-containing protein n=1 Tax=Garciella nitratireducens DSM 15102 TaxID=1121911 RepID=A0A1T4PM79_9FIRM|nr:NYN domain-containing protein [Garciella nitratireducens]SJZ91998.1 hypothetical protein SAMN02745973_02118 [Garciella nitratireducens DSM 15102]